MRTPLRAIAPYYLLCMRVASLSDGQMAAAAYSYSRQRCTATRTKDCGEGIELSVMFPVRWSCGQNQDWKGQGPCTYTGASEM